MKCLIRSSAFSVFIASFLCSFVCAIASANVVIPNYSPNVVDPNGHLTTTEKEEINRAIDRIQSRGAIKPAVYLLSSLGGESIESLSEKAFRKWQLGEKGKDNGLLLVLAMEDRQMRIETGYGLEGNLPDWLREEFSMKSCGRNFAKEKYRLVFWHRLMRLKPFTGKG